MLSGKKIEILESIVNDNEELIRDLAQANKVSNPDVSIRVAKFLVADANNFSKMSEKQKYHYENAIEPLINDVPCEGMIGEYDSCRGTGFIYEENLVWAYRDQDMRCQECIGEKNRWNANNP